MVNKSFSLTIGGKTYQVSVPAPDMIVVDDNLFKVEMLYNSVKVNNKTLVCSLTEDFAIVGGKLYDTSWKTA